jgi:aspartate-semialdehyde dehydrogenase
MTKIPVTILGATGVVGQRFVRRLAAHPWFEIRHLAASVRSAGRPYAEACEWRLPGVPHGGLGDQVLEDCDPETCAQTLVFSALDAGPARDLEPAFARAGSLVFSNASAWRMEEDVPLLIPEVNPEHLGLLEGQRAGRGWRGGIVCNPNCTTTVLVMALAPLEAAFGIEAVMVTSMQAVSGGGYPGVPALDILGNVVPFIRGEEEKVAEEVPKLLGVCRDGRVEPASLQVSAMCHRVPVLDGHLEAVSVALKGRPGPRAVQEALEAWRPEPQRLGLPSAPDRPVRCSEAEDRPQPRKDVEEDEGMSVHVGRIRPCPVLGLKFAVLGHNTERGAAGGSVLNAELAFAQGLGILPGAQ